MKILMIDSLVGNDYSVCLCTGLSNTGLDVRLLTPENKQVSGRVNFKVLRWAPSKVRGESKTAKLIKFLEYHLQILISIKNKEIDIIHYQFFRHQFFECIFIIILRQLGIPVVFTAHNVMPHEKSRQVYTLNKMVYKYSKAIIVHSEYIKKTLVANFNINEEKIAVIPHGNFDFYLPKLMITKVDARKKIGLSVNDDVLLFFGHIRKYKGLDLLLDGFEIAAGKNSKLHLIIAGAPFSKELADEYRVRIENIATSDRIHYYSEFIPQDDVSTYFLAADLIVLPYKNIYHSGIMHLAFSFGKPIIATDIGDFRETIEHGKGGYILERNNAETLAETIAKTFFNKKVIANMGKYVKALSDTKYSWNDIAARTRELYEWATR